MVRFAQLLRSEVLEEKRHTGERAIRERPCGLASGAVELPMDHGVDLRIERLDARDRGVDQLACSDIAVGHELGEPGCVVVVEEITHRQPPISWGSDRR